jgi:hypothetical protein
MSVELVSDDVVSVDVVSEAVVSVFVVSAPVKSDESEEIADNGPTSAMAPAAIRPAAKHATTKNESFSSRRRCRRPRAGESISPSPWIAARDAPQRRS